MTDNARPLKGSNRHPVDELGETRARIKALQDREKTLKDQVAEMMGSADSLGGDEWIAKQTVSERKGSLDEKALKAKFGEEAVDACRKPTTTSYAIRVDRRVVAEEDML